MIDEEKRNKYLDVNFNSMEDYIEFLVEEKAKFGELGWQDVADLVEEKFKFVKSRHWYYRNFGDSCNIIRDNFLQKSVRDEKEDKNEYQSFQDKLLEIKKERVKMSDERTQAMAYVRRIAREETLKEIAMQAVDKMSCKKILEKHDKRNSYFGEKEAIVLLSDWHYGFDFKIPWNEFNTDVCKKRVQTLLDETMEYCRKNGVGRVHVFNLSDLIAGRIHLTIRLESRIDTITQTMEVSEILSEFLNTLTEYFDVDYYSCIDNHSRVEPNKSDSLDLESLCRITDWYLNSRVGDRVTMHSNEFGLDIISANILGHNIAGIHGHLDKPQKCIEDISIMTRKNYDLICMAHLHHFSMDERGGCRVVCNGALLGTDKFASNLRLYSKPSQTIIIVSKERACEDIHIVEL